MGAGREVQGSCGCKVKVVLASSMAAGGVDVAVWWAGGECGRCVGGPVEEQACQAVCRVQGEGQEASTNCQT